MREGDLDLHEAVDVLQDAAVQTGLVERARSGRGAGHHGHGVRRRARARDRRQLSRPGARDGAGNSRGGKHGRGLDVQPVPARRGGPGGKTCQSRLAELSTAQIRSVIERLIVARPRFRAIDDELLFLLGEQLT